MKTYYVYDGCSYYVDEDNFCIFREGGKKFESIQEIITTVPLLKDWNLDLEIYELVNDKLIHIPYDIWRPFLTKWREENGAAFSQLYSIPRGMYTEIRQYRMK